MRILIDEDLSEDLIDLLRSLGHDAEHVYTKHLGSAPDRELQKIAEAEDRLLLTCDRGFADARNFTPGNHPGIAVVKLKEANYFTIQERVRIAFTTGDLDAWRGCIVILEDEEKVRIRRG
ncbi:MAG TPA: DUF5615 family PIN-like protein [Thermoanaerobaculia bacterium]|nr:DUF5615 family PIN-like protein [Thermoanaerobaculia bacterium]